MRRPEGDKIFAGSVATTPEQFVRPSSQCRERLSLFNDATPALRGG
jgi:hypothetical protein